MPVLCRYILRRQSQCHQISVAMLGESIMQEDNSTVSKILVFLSAYGFKEVKAAVKILSKNGAMDRSERKRAAYESLAAMGWVENTAGVVPSGFEWQKIGHRIFIRDPSKAKDDRSRVTVHGSKAGTRHREHKKTDTSVKPVSDLKCPSCNGGLFKEGICPGCEEGRRGFKVRLLCGECEYSLSL